MREQTTLYGLVQQYAARFIAHTEASTGAELPRLITGEFDAYLECGILTHGILRLRCGECGHCKLLAFSCKRRGFCASCGARRMSQTAAHLVDHVIPHVPVRQWVLSLPTLLRVLLAAARAGHAGAAGRAARGHAPSAGQRSARDGRGLRRRRHADPALRLVRQPQHPTALPGTGRVYRCGADGAPAFVEVDAPTDDALHALLQTAIARLIKMLTRRSVLVEEMRRTCRAEPDADGQEARTLRPLHAAAVTYRIAFGPRAGQKVFTLRGAMPRDAARGYGTPATLCRHRRLQFACRGAGRGERPQAAGATVPLHHPADAVRQTLAAQRRRASTLKLKTPWRNGMTQLVMSALEPCSRWRRGCRGRGCTDSADQTAVRHSRPLMAVPGCR